MKCVCNTRTGASQVTSWYSSPGSTSSRFLVRVPLQRARKQVVDVLVSHVEVPALVLGKLDGDRLGAAVQMHAVRMARHALVV